MFPTNGPTSLPTISNCVGNHYGTFGNTSSNNHILVPYNYEMVSNTTKISNNGLILSDVVLDVEYAIVDMLVKNLFTECVDYYRKTQGVKKKRRQLIAGQIIGISSKPNDIVTDGK